MLAIDPELHRARLELATVYFSMERFEEAARFLTDAINRKEEGYSEEILEDPALQALIEHEAFKKLNDPEQAV